MGLPLLLGVAGLAGAGAYAIGKGSSDEPRESVQKDETPTATATQGQGTDGNGGQYNFSELEMNAPQQTFKSTNVAYLDKKLADGTANFWDALAAKQFLGMNLGEYGHQSLDVNFNGKHAIKNLNKLYENGNKVAANADLYKATLAAGFVDNGLTGNLGIVSEAVRDLHEIAPFVPISEKNNLYRNLQNNMAFAAAQDMSGGNKPNLWTQQRAIGMYGHNSRGEKQQASLMASALKQNNIALMQNIEQIRAVGGQVPQKLKDTLIENEAMIADLLSKDFNRKKFMEKWKIDINQRAANYAAVNFDDENSSQPAQSVVERN